MSARGQDWAISSVGPERPPHTREVSGSSPLSPTIPFPPDSHPFPGEQSLSADLQNLYALQKLDLEVDPEIEQMQLRVKRARIGLVSSAFGFVVGVALVAAALANTRFQMCLWEPCPPPPPQPNWVEPVAISGGVLIVGASAGVLATGILLGTRKRQLRELERLKPWPRRVQWDLAQSRLVF